MCNLLKAENYLRASEFTCVRIIILTLCSLHHPSLCDEFQSTSKGAHCGGNSLDRSGGILLLSGLERISGLAHPF